MTTALLIGVLLLFVVLIGRVLVAIWRAVREQARWTEATQRILASGVSADAVIRTVGPSKLGARVFTIGLEVQPSEGTAPFSATVEELVPAYATGAIEPGKQVRVRFEPQSRAVAIDFAAMGL